MSVTTTAAPTWTPMTSEQREQFDTDGYLVLRGVLSPDEVRHYSSVLDAAHAGHPRASDGSLHLLSAVANCPELVDLIDHPATFPLVWSVLGWNIHIYHSHLDVHPPLTAPKPDWWHWHQDGGRQNRELETDPRPRLSVKLAYWLSDVSRTGRGNLTLIPGSHKTNWLPGPPKRDVPWPTPDGARQVTVNAGDVVFFDRRIWHARSDNLSKITRKCVFLGYTYRWISIRDEVGALPGKPWWARLNPVQQQLLGGVGGSDGDHSWGHYPETTPLYTELLDRGLLDPDHPPLIP
ncbi:phytanoyl-CoA dioxygenase family protein [Dactylosporangium roseum]|uniref:Phytanoyl-CoA dioxygenase family protein n=1 Tax=Dactylosporangium roseum TaxID=47989 RepID=A0ABY5Z3U4_9ACTN|nr:phytanoyl-CoA dioxygenase family protein [Dactylosporangium roseum]UWZ36711.1 phytanoyl-CoA dioxygenase family protein [Dactylosporangium roseum]